MPSCGSKLYAVTSFAEVEGIFADYLAQPRALQRGARSRDGATDDRALEADAGVRRERVRDLLTQVADGSVAGRLGARRTARRSRRSRSASPRSTIIARCGRDFPRSSTAPGRRRSRSSRSRSASPSEATEYSSRGCRRMPSESASARALPGAEHNALARTVLLRPAHAARRRQGAVLIVTAGTSDLPVAEEAAVTADAMGCVRRAAHRRRRRRNPPAARAARACWIAPP